MPPPTTVGDASLVVTGAGPRRRANNNLDVLDFGGRRYLAWRSAPTHFASRHAQILVASSGDEGRSWRLEHTIALGRDVREPRLFDFHGRLQLFFFTAGTRWHRFEPDRIHVSLLEEGNWSDPIEVSDVDHVEWRVRWLGDAPLMTVYRGAATLGTGHADAPRVALWTTVDGIHWGPLSDGFDAPFPTGTETDIIRLHDGTLVGVTRMDGPDSYGSGIGVRPTGSDRWSTRIVSRKLDSPLLFEHRGEPLLIARRSLGWGGRFDLGLPIGGGIAKMRLYQAVYAASRKRTSLWRIDRRQLTLEHLTDLPGRGDTCFPAVVPLGGDSIRVYNYSSELDGPDRPWILGLLGPTSIYATEVRFTGAPGTMFSGHCAGGGSG